MRYHRVHATAVAVCLSILLAGGCGPLFLPITAHLREEDQKTYDSMWNNMLTPVNRVSHQTLLDTVIVYVMFQLGVDRLHLVSEKYLEQGKVIMEIDCDRASPETDQFTILVVDDRGRTLRRERYSRQEIEDTARELTRWPTTWPAEPATRNVVESSTQPTTAPSTQTASKQPTTCPETPQERERRLEYERRVKAIEAATQPARLQ